MGKVAKDKRDIYYRLAKQQGWRSRSAFKLLQINDYFKIFNQTDSQGENVRHVVDLCAAPGGWSQVASKFLSQISSDYKIIAVDLQDMTPIEGVDIFAGDITSQNTLIQILKLADGNFIDLVMCDGAPDITGFNEFDVYIQSQLVLSALNISIRMLKFGGTFICKLFKGKHTNKVLQILKNFFSKITLAKPLACRNATFESFLVCQGFKIEEDLLYLRKGELTEKDIIVLNNLYKGEEIDMETLGIDLIQVGNNQYDSDKTYDLQSTNYTTILKPVQEPINPPYKYYIDNMKGISNIGGKNK
jgi:tRNA (cytidine32/guanosine34-2'-O)-methyltransferase